MGETRSVPARSRLVEGNPWVGLWHLAWPLVLTMLLNATTGLLDAWIAGHISPTAQAAVGLTLQLIFLINTTTMATSIGTQALVSRFVGAGAWGDAAAAAKQSLVVGAVFTLLLIGPVLLFAPALFAAVGAAPDVAEAGSMYLRWLMLGLLPMDLAILLHAVFRARGNTRSMLAGAAVEAVVWAGCSLGLGLWGGWGLHGLAAGFVAGKTAGFVTCWWLFTRMPLYAYVPRSWKLDRGWARRILAIGVPGGVQALSRNLGGMAFFGVLGLTAHPTAAVAACAIGFRIESVAFLPVFAFNIAAATMVGQNLGASQPERAQRSAWQIVGVAVALMTAFGVFFFTQAEFLASRFAPDPVVASFVADYLRIMALSEPFLAVTMVLNGALQGAGETKPPMMMTFAAQIGLRLPAAFFLAVPLGHGPMGAWWAMAGSMVVQSALVVWWFRRGTWRTREV